jgi:hypothetical protein
MLYLFNTTIMPNEGTFTNRKVTEAEVRQILRRFSNNFTSAIGHQATADAFNSLFAVGVEVNRIPATMAEGDEAIALKIMGRLPEGQILTTEELNKIGFEFYHIRRLATPTQTPDKKYYVTSRRRW